ncbi:hypothetical protein FA15DRAFT_668942 [Coprinopsis marcescibilis]|uniref:DNA-directed RNA polymerase III subunit RPC3 n=1 Tax=Coprinopsis marcescibilis TaxID=230819 RepID=A0A5C3KWN9_COPMA|nr:hypothetical protein FA15DRAFT_668942 [Coprinopsis marcescibilis]
MADFHTGRLCTEIIDTQFGSLTSKVASVLLIRGRLSLPQIVRYSGLKPRTIRACILILIQHNIVWHVQRDGDPEMYEINVEECLLRLRYGRYIYYAESLFGNPGAEIVQIIMDHGKLRPPDILALLHKHDSKVLAQYKQALYKLVSGSYLKASTARSHVSPRDRQLQYEIEEIKKFNGHPTPKQIRELKEVAEARLKRELDESEKIGLITKAKEITHQRSGKRKVQEEESVVDDEVFFRVNCQRFNVHIRNEIIVRAAKERYNSQAASVVQAAITGSENAQSSVSEVRSDPVSISRIIMLLADNDDLQSGLAYSSKKVPIPTCVKDYLGLLSSADNPTPAGKANAFVSFGGSKVQVEYETICRTLRRKLLESIALEKHGHEGVRIIRLLLDTGKMDEKQIAKVVMMASKDVRPLLAAMSADSLISTQEVPKSADRNPTRTFYLWYVDLYKGYSSLLAGAYKILYNIGQRRRAEREASDVKAVLEKSLRTDVQQDESLLTRMERETLKEWEDRELRLTVLESRAEETVFILKDLAVHGIGGD